jgi:hypothetical protein
MRERAKRAGHPKLTPGAGPGAGTGIAPLRIL